MQSPSDQEFTRAAGILAAGGLVAFPTETVYGLGADATRDHAVARLYAAKGRPSFNPLIVHIPDPGAAREIGAFDARASRLAEAFWPGALTLVLPRRPGCGVSLLVSAGLPAIALRIPDHPVAQALLRAFGKPLAAPSANLSGRMSPTTANHVRDGLGSRVDLVLDGGPTAIGLESTIVGLTGSHPTLLRPGGIARGDIEAVLGEPLMLPDPTVRPESPGQLESHYAPRARMRLNSTSARNGEIFLGFGPNSPPPNLSVSGDLVEAAANLFRILHELDASGVEAIAVAPIPMTGLGEAINDRLARAAAPRPAS
ncbi:L-threonylcarbamoyladenylate synthase [soil metagenome]